MNISDNINVLVKMIASTSQKVMWLVAMNHYAVCGCIQDVYETFKENGLQKWIIK